MKYGLKKLLALTIALALLVSVLALPAWAEPATVVDSGNCGGEGDGTNLTWTLTEDGVLAISGEGAMADWGDSSSVPWYNIRNSIKTVVIGNSVTTIGDYAFYYCDYLTTVTIPDSVTNIGDEAFELCLSLTSVTIGNSVTTIGDWAFADCTSLAEVTIPDSVTTIGISAFSGCTSLAEVTIPDSVTTIGEGAFSYCYSLAEVIIPDSVTTIGGYAFTSCRKLTNVTIGDSVATIGGGAFESCTSLTEVTIPDSVTTIGYVAFYNCTALADIYFEGDAPTFGDNKVFWRVAATAYYPAGNDTWTDDVMQDYGGDITWVSATAIQCNSCTETKTEVTVFAGADVTGTMVGYIAIYDKDGRFLRAEMVEEQVSSAGSLQLSIDYTEEESLQMGRISVYAIDKATWIPLCREWSKTVNF